MSPPFLLIIVMVLGFINILFLVLEKTYYYSLIGIRASLKNVTMKKLYFSIYPFFYPCPDFGAIIVILVQDVQRKHTIPISRVMNHGFKSVASLRRCMRYLSYLLFRFFDKRGHKTIICVITLQVSSYSDCYVDYIMCN